MGESKGLHWVGTGPLDDRLGDLILRDGEPCVPEDFRSEWNRFALLEGSFLAACQQQVQVRELPSAGLGWLNRLRDSRCGERNANLIDLLHHRFTCFQREDPQLYRFHRLISIAMLSLTELALCKNALRVASLAKGADQPPIPEVSAIVRSLERIDATTEMGEPPFGMPFFNAMYQAISGEPQVPTGTVTVLFPLISGREGVLARFILEQMPEGNGKLFINPEQAFLVMGTSFRSIFSNATAVANQIVRPSGDVRVRIEAFDPGDQHTIQQIDGSSAGSALALGLCSLWSGRALEANIVVSSALTPPTDDPPDGRCYAISGVTAKAVEVAKHRMRLVVADEQVERFRSRARELGLAIIPAGTVREAFEIATGRLDAIRQYLDAVTSKVAVVPHYYPRGSRLERVRVRVRVSSDRIVVSPTEAVDGEQVRPRSTYRWRLGALGAEDTVESRPRSGENRPRVEILDWDREVRNRVHRAVIAGDPGLGKTWLLRWEAKRLAQEAIDQISSSADVDQLALPVFLRLSDVARALGGRGDENRVSFPIAIMRAIQRTYPSLSHVRGLGSGREGVLEFIRNRLGTNQVILLLDALDEVPPELRDDLLDAVSTWVPAHPEAPVWLTSRIVNYVSPWNIAQSDTEREMELMPFAADQIEAFVRGWYGDEDSSAKSLLRVLRDAAHLRGMAEIPLLLGFLCALAQESERLEGSAGSILQYVRRADVYKNIVTKLLRREWHDPRPYIDDGRIEEKKELLRQLAFELFFEGKEQFAAGELRNLLASIVRRLDLGDFPSIRTLLRELTEQDGILIKAGAGTDPPYLFLHLTIQEYLTACCLGDCINEEGWEADVGLGGSSIQVRTLIDKKAWDPRWEQVIVMLAGQLRDPLPLLEMLADEGVDDLFRHRLAVAAHCLAEIPRVFRAYTTPSI